MSTNTPHFFKRCLLASSIACATTHYGAAHAQQVAYLDSGVDPTRGFNIVGGFNYYNNTDDTSDVSDRESEGHGTVSARLITESFSGPIVPFVITDGDLTGANEGQVTIARDAALSDILGKADIRVVGITWGTSGIANSSAPLMSDLSRANKVIAIMAGNDVAAQPSALATSSFNLSGVLIVGATDAEGVLLPESNRAGTTANKYVAANGLPVEGADLGGSSWATARISGIAGAVLQQNPDLTAAEVVDVILQSAEDRGDPGTDNVYGRGVILNAEQVLNNVIGPPTVPTEPVVPPVTNTGGGGGGGGGAAILLVGGALAGALLLGRKSKTKLEKTLVLDSYGRSFSIDLSDEIAINDDSLQIDQFFQSLDSKTVSAQVAVPDLNTQLAFSAAQFTDPRIDFIEYFALPNDRGIEPRHNNLSFVVDSQLAPQLSMNGGYQVSPHQQFGGVRLLDVDSEFGASSFLSGQAFSSVLMGFSAQADTFSMAYHAKQNRDTAIALGLVSVDGDDIYRQHSFSSFLQGSFQLNERAGVNVQFGQIKENGSVLGGASNGILAVDSATTYAINMAGTLALNDQFSIVSNYGIGRTVVDAADNSLLKDFSNLRSDWYSVGLIGQNVWRERDQFGVSISQPLKIRSGEVDYSIPYTRLANGNIGFNTERVSLSDTNATERNVEAYYRTKLSDKIELGAFAQYRQNPNHFSGLGNDTVVMATIRFTQ